MFSFLKTTKEIKRKVNIKDTTKPVIKLQGSSEITLEYGSNYNEPGIKAYDNYDGDISNQVKISGSVDVNKAGEYIIKYEVQDSSENKSEISRKIIIKEKPIIKTYNSGLTYIKGILLVNKKYSVPPTYGGVDSTAYNALKALQNAANSEGFNIPLKSGYRSYNDQKIIYNNYYAKDGEFANTYSAKPGHSEHQTGLAFDVGSIDDNFGDTKEGIWLKENCYKYGFIIRYPKGKEHITGYQYEPWHIRYLGVQVATEISNKKITLEEYLGV